MNKDLIAPCGMNCGVCKAYLRTKNKCPGCFSGRKVSGRPIKCGRRLCKKRQGNFCFECADFPCESIKRLDERYRERYNMSEIENLEFIKNHGLDKFLAEQKRKYCKGDKIFCVHNKKWYKVDK